MTDNKVLAETIRNYLESGVDLRLTDDDYRTIIKALEQESILGKIKDYINHIGNTGMGKKKSLEFIEKYIDGLKAESEVENDDR